PQLPIFPAAAHQPPLQIGSETLHAVARSHSAFVPARRYAIGPLTALPAACCKSRCPAPTGPGTTIAAAQMTTATGRPNAPALQLPLSATAAPSLLLPPAAPLRYSGSNRAASALQTTAAVQLQLQTLAALSRSPVSPVTNDRPARRSSRHDPRRPASTLHSRSPPAALLPVSIHSLLPGPAHLLLRVPAISADRASHSLSAVAAPTLPSAAAPCIPAAAPADNCVTAPLPRAHCPPFLLHNPPATALRAPAPLLAALQHDAPAPPRSRPTQSGTRAASPARPVALHTRARQSPGNAPDHPCSTAARLRAHCTGAAQTAPPSRPAVPD